MTYQADPEHSGHVSDPRLKPPLRRAWARSFPADISYSVIAEGKVFVIARRYDDDRYGVDLYALSPRDGRTLWKRDLGPRKTANLAYDEGRLYVVRWGDSDDDLWNDSGGGLTAFSAADGRQLWQTPFELWSGPPVATGGNVYVDGSGAGSWFGAFRGADGTELWRVSVGSGGSGALAVTGDAVYFSGSCPNVWAARRADGGVLWKTPEGCTGGGGSTPVHHQGRLYVREDRDYPPGDVYDAGSGSIVGPMRSDLPPAFGGGLGLFADRLIPGESHQFGHVMTARSVADGRVRWRFRGDGYLDTAPLIVNRTVYVGSGSGRLYGLSLDRGRVVWRTDLGRPLWHSGDDTGIVSGLAAGEGLLVVPAWRRLVAFRR